MEFARDFLNVFRNHVAGQIFAKPLDELNTLFHWDMKMCRSRNGVELMQVVGDHSAIDQSCTEVGQRVEAVINAAQQDALIEQDRPRVLHLPNSVCDFRIDFIGMVCV